MPLILGIDSSLTNTGLCHIWASKGGQEISTATVPTTPTAFGGTSFLSYSRRISYIVGVVDSYMKGVDLVVIEALAYGARGGSVWTLPWLWGRIVDAAVARDIPVIAVGTSQRAKYATGKGNAPKDAVLAATIRRWPSVAIDGNDVADALILAAIGARFLGYPVDEMPKAHYIDVMKKLAA